MSKYQAFVLIGEYDTESEAIEALELQALDNQKTLIRAVESGVENS